MGARVMVLLLSVVVLCGGPAAGAGPHLSDPRGDYPLSDGDIVAATFSTVDKGRTLRVDLLLAEVPDERPFGYDTHSYSIGFTAGKCVFIAMRFYSGEAWGRCDGPEELEVGDQVDRVELRALRAGATITYLIPLSGPIKRGMTASDIGASTFASGALAGRSRPGDPPTGDVAESDQTYRI